MYVQVKLPSRDKQKQNNSCIMAQLLVFLQSTCDQMFFFFNRHLTLHTLCSVCARKTKKLIPVEPPLPHLQKTNNYLYIYFSGDEAVNADDDDDDEHETERHRWPLTLWCRSCCERCFISSSSKHKRTDLGRVHPASLLFITQRNRHGNAESWSPVWF